MTKADNMENKINIAELLMDCPKGMKLYSPIFGEVYLKRADNDDATIVITTKHDFPYSFFKDGSYSDCRGAECMLFPSSDHRTWEDFKVPKKEFKAGGVVVLKSASAIGVVREKRDGLIADTLIDPILKCFGLSNVRLATDEEINEWNTLLLSYRQHYSKSKRKLIHWFLPFDRVLVRDDNNETWKIDLFERYSNENEDLCFCCLARDYDYCIPYEGNEHLLGTTNEYTPHEL